MRAPGARRGAPRAAVVLLLALATGCGNELEVAGGGPAAASITISAAITPRGVAVSPARFGAGPIELVASNQTSRSQRLQLRSERLAAVGPPLTQRTGPIPPGGTASLRADVSEGAYIVSARGSSIEPAMIAVAAPRERTQGRGSQP